MTNIKTYGPEAEFRCKNTDEYKNALKEWVESCDPMQGANIELLVSALVLSNIVVLLSPSYRSLFVALLCTV